MLRGGSGAGYSSGRGVSAAAGRPRRATGRKARAADAERRGERRAGRPAPPGRGRRRKGERRNSQSEQQSESSHTGEVSGRKKGYATFLSCRYPGLLCNSASNSQHHTAVARRRPPENVVQSLPFQVQEDWSLRRLDPTTFHTRLVLELNWGAAFFWVSRSRPLLREAAVSGGHPPPIHTPSPPRNALNRAAPPPNRINQDVSVGRLGGRVPTPCRLALIFQGGEAGRRPVAGGGADDVWCLCPAGTPIADRSPRL